MITIALCDDEIEYMQSTMRQHISEALKETGLTASVEYFRTGSRLIEYFQDNRCDIVILDIDMPQMNGKDLARELRKIDSSFFLIFVSSYPEEVFDTLKYKINAFIPKRSDNNTFHTEICRVFREYSDYNSEYVIVNILKNGCPVAIKIHTTNILGFFLNNRYIYLKTALHEYILEESTFKNIVSKYTDKGFIQCSRNYLVNIRHITEIQTSSLTLSNGTSFPVSRRQHCILLKEFSKTIMHEVDL